MTDSTNTYLKIKFPNEYDEFLQHYDEDSPIIPLIQEFMSKLNIQRWFDMDNTDFCVYELNIKFIISKFHNVKFCFNNTGKVRLTNIVFKKPIESAEITEFYEYVKTWGKFSFDSRHMVFFNDSNESWNIDNPPDYILRVLNHMNNFSYENDQ